MQGTPLRERSRRAQAQVLGFAILFAIAMTALTLYQVNVVPAKNEGVEFEHTRDAARDLTTFQDRLRAASASGEPTSTSVQLGVRYPDRSVGVNAPDPRGRLATTSQRTIRIENAEPTDPEVADYWERLGALGTAREFDTRYLTYSPSYSYRESDPQFRLEPGLLARQVDGGTIVESGNGPVSGNRIELVTVAGEYSTSGYSESVELVPTGGPAATRTITGDGGPITLVVPTDLPEGAWEEALGAEPHVNSVTRTGGAVEIELDGSEEYQLRVPRTGLRSSPEATAEYITGGPTMRSTQAEGRESLTVTVRDAFGNPVSGATVEADVTTLGSGHVEQNTRQTGADGTATFVYDPDGSNEDATVTTKIGSSPLDFDDVEFDIDVSSSGSSTGPGPGPSSAESDTAGIGSRTDYQRQQRLTIAETKGRWENVDSFDAIYLSEGRFRRTDPTTNTVAMTLDFYIQDPDTEEFRTVHVELQPPDSPGNAWQAKKVKIEGPDRTYINDAPLTDEAADRIVGRNGRSGRVDLLDNSNYESRPAGPWVTPADRQAIGSVASSNSFIYFRTMSQGIVDLEIE